ncbi:Cytochrome P450 3A5 [Araneus ventricosus]|uniref:Cytochrome P450 3A5 n=1 Tax=Araneus ventricosus TaxID=182803 RepID=A0A4Y2MEN2_ARAVE|nr:Cytochrome P450 3A5 [Araneus ventricosus]
MDIVFFDFLLYLTLKSDSNILMFCELAQCRSVGKWRTSYETTSTALAFTTYLLAKHQDVQENLYQEIKDMIERGQKLEYATINKLHYLDKVLNESMRIYPPIHLFTNRYALEDVQYGDIHIPEGTLIQAPVYLMHHDPDFWSEPEIFDPERFSAKPNSEGITYLPFGVGPRNCLGMRFAQLEAKLALANMVYKFNIKLDEKQKDNLEVMCRIRTITPGKVRVKLGTRNENN